MDDDTQVVADTTPSAEDTAAKATNDSASVQSEGTPEASQTQEAAQETATTDINAEDTVQDKLFAGKYKTPEDLEKAYAELNSKFTSTSQEKAELSKLLTDAFSTDTTQGTQTQDEDYDDAPKQTQGPSKNDVDISVMKFLFTHEGADGKAINDVLNNDPLVQSIGSVDAKLEYAYLRSQNMSQSKAIETARKEAAQAAQTKTIEKQAAQVEAPAKSEPTDPKAELRQKAIQGDQSARIEFLKGLL